MQGGVEVCCCRVSIVQYCGMWKVRYWVVGIAIEFSIVYVYHMEYGGGNVECVVVPCRLLCILQFSSRRICVYYSMCLLQYVLITVCAYYSKGLL